MSPIGIRRQLIRCRRHLTVMAVMVALSAALAMHHSGIATGAMHDDHAIGAAVEMCLGVMSTIATVIVASAVGVLALAWPPRALVPAGLARCAYPPLPRARAGPPLLFLLCVNRR